MRGNKCLFTNSSRHTCQGGSHHVLLPAITGHIPDGMPIIKAVNEMNSKHKQVGSRGCSVS